MTERQFEPGAQVRDALLSAIPIPAQRDAVAGWLAECRTPLTADGYARGGMAFVRWLQHRGPVDLAAVRRLDVAQYSAHVRDSYSPRTGRKLAPATVAKQVAIVSSMLTYAVQVGAVEHNPARDVRRVKVPTEGTTPARSADDLARMFGGTSSRDDVVIGLLYITALRVTELCNADVRGLVTDRGVRFLRVRTKGGKTRDVQLPPAILEPLLAYLGDRTDGPLVVDSHGKRITRNQVVYLLRRVAREKGVPDPSSIRPHVIRTSAITHELDAGTPLQEVQAWVGHDRSDTTMRYRRRSRGHERDAEIAARMAERLTGGRS